MLPSNVIRQTNDILYGSQFQSMSPTTAIPTSVLQQPITQTAQPQFIPAPTSLPNPIQQGVDPRLPSQYPESHGQLTNILQSLDTRLGKIENQLSLQNQQMGQQNTRIHNIESHVEQITVLKQCMTTVQTKMYTMEVDMSHIKTKQSEYDTSIQTYSSLCDEVLKSQSKINQRIDELSNTLNFLQTSELENIKSDHQDLREDFLDTKCRQMCENLIFTGIEEVQLGLDEKEDCEKTLVKFLTEVMCIYTEIEFDRVHRLGRYRRNQARPRPIIAKFHEYKAKEMVKARAPTTLIHTQYGVREQYPDEYERRRKVLYPKMKAAKNTPGNKVRLVKDTLYINDEKFVCGQDNVPVKVVYQNTDRSKNFSAQTVPVPDRNTRPSRMPEPQRYTRTLPQNPRTPQRQYTRPPPPTGEARGPPPAWLVTPQNYVNFESGNRFTCLPRDDSGNSRGFAGKTKASSPLDNLNYTKKQRDDVSENRDVSAMELTSGSGPTSECNNPRQHAEIQNTQVPNQNSAQPDTSKNNELSTQSENQTVSNQAENHENHVLPPTQSA